MTVRKWVLVHVLLCAQAVPAMLLAEDWPRWRGPRGNGISAEAAAPVRFGKGEGLIWRVETPGHGHSSPVVVGDAVYITAAAGEGSEARRVVLRYGARDGRVVWEEEALRAPLEGKHQKNSHASGTPCVADGALYAAFFGNGRAHVAALDAASGKVLWRVSPAGFKSVHGFCTSPFAHGDLLIVNLDQDSEESALFALDRASGAVRWRTERENHLRSYVTPLVIDAGGRSELVISGQKMVAAYDPSSGKRLWWCDGPTEQCVASPVAGNGLVYITGGFPDRHILAIKPGGQGDVTESRIVWHAEKGPAYVPSPLLLDGRLYVVHDETGVLSAYEAQGGKLLWQERLGGGVSSSLTFAAGNIYVGSEAGTVHVFRPGGRFDRVARNDLGEPVFASPAFSNRRLFLRTTKALYCFGEAQSVGVLSGDPGGAAVLASTAAAGSPAGGSEAAPDDTPPPPSARPAAAALTRVLDPGRLPADARLGKPRDLNGYHPFTPITDAAAWAERARRVREQVLVAAGLWPMPERTPLEAVIHSPIDREDYTVERVFFQSHPGFYVTGNLYRPKGGPPGRRPAVLCPHGHWQNGRLFERSQKDAEAELKGGGEKTMEGATYPLQARCAQLARMGCVVFFYDMVGYADSTQIPHTQGFRDAEAELRLQSFFGLQTWDSIRALDFLAGLPDVDPARIGVTGASGGGTQTFILCAVDDRPAAAFPAVMVSTSMQGGCVCENGSLLRVGTCNVEFAALTAPRPLGMTGAHDWTEEIETKGLPELKTLYEAVGAPGLVMAKCFPQFEHNYNQVSREVMYGFMNRHLRLGQPETIAERPFRPIPPAELHVFDDAHPRKGGVDPVGLRQYLTEASERQMAALRPRTPAGLAEFRRVVGTALRAMLSDELPAPGGVSAERAGESSGEARGTKFKVEKLLLSRKGSGEAVPAVLFSPERPSGVLVVVAHPEGKERALLLSSGDEVHPAAAALLARGAMVLSIDALHTGEYRNGEKPASRPPVDKGYAGFTLGYSRSLLAERVHDVLTAVAYARVREGVKRVRLVGLGKAGVWAVLARAVAGNAIDRTAANLQGFRFEDVKDVQDEMLLPGAVKYGGLPAFAALCAPGELWLGPEAGGMEIAEEAYRASGKPAGLRLGRPAKGDDAAMNEWIAEPGEPRL